MRNTQQIDGTILGLTTVRCLFVVQFKSFSFILGVMLFFNTACAQFNSFKFNIQSDSVFQLVDLGDFSSAQDILIQIDSSGWRTNDKNRADFYFTRAYYNLFASGEFKSLDDFVRAGKIYTLRNDERFRHLVEVFLIVDLYVKTHWDEAIKRAHNALEFIPQEEAELQAYIHTILAASYCGHLPDKIKGHAFGNKAIPYFLKHKNHRRLIAIYGVMAACYGESKNIESRLAYVDSAIIHAKQINHEKQLAFLQIRKANAYRAQGKFAKALVFLAIATEYFEQHPTEQGQLEWVGTLESLTNAQMGNYKKAYEILENNRIKSATRRNKDLDSQINTLMVKYETSQKQHEIELQRLEIQNQRQKTQNQLLIGVGAMLIMLSGFFFFYWRNKIAQQTKNSQLEMAHQSKLLETIVESTEAERKRISQDLHDGVGQKLTGLKMAWQSLNSSTPNQSKGQSTRLTSLIEETHKEIRELSHQLMPASLRKLGLVSAIEDCLDQLLTPNQISYEFEYLDQSQRFDPKVEVGLFRIAQELLNNIVKYAGANQVDIELFKLNNRLIFTVRENGRGFDFENKKNDGNGLYNIESRIKTLNGFLSCERLDTGGMLTTIRVPL